METHLIGLNSRYFPICKNEDVLILSALNKPAEYMQYMGYVELIIA